MASLNNTISGRITLAVLAIHVVLLPALYFGMVFLIKQSNEEYFLNNVRGHARFLADSLERVGDTATDEEITEILDSVVLSGGGVFAELRGESRQILSSLVSEADAEMYREDHEFQEFDDGTYYFSLPIVQVNGSTNLRIGFDESPYLAQNAAAYKNGFIILAGYVTALLILLPLVGRRVAQPIKALQEASREIASGAVSGHLTVKTDLVEFVELSHDLELMKDRLTGISEQLQQEITDREKTEVQRLSLEQQLRHSQRLETVGTMAGGIAHELNNILVPIILFTETAVEDLPPDSPARDDLQRVIAAATRARGLVSQVLMFSRKMGDDEHLPVDMAEIIRESAELLRASVTSFAKLELLIDEDCPPVLGNAALIGQLILNLCSNAFKALKNGQGIVSIHLALVAVEPELARASPQLGEHCVCVTIRDDGQGMSEETRSRIFEPFFTTRGVGEGTGLGLSVVHGIITDMNGIINVESEVESGSVFRTFLPASTDEGNQPS